MDRNEKDAGLHGGGARFLRAPRLPRDHLLRRSPRRKTHPPGGQGHHVRQRRPLPQEVQAHGPLPRRHERSRRHRVGDEGSQRPQSAHQPDGRHPPVREHAQRHGNEVRRRRQGAERQVDHDNGHGPRG